MSINCFIHLSKYKMDIRHQLWLILYFSIYLENKSTLNLGLNVNWPFGLSLHIACDLNMSLNSVMCLIKSYEFNFIWFKINTIWKNIFSLSLEWKSLKYIMCFPRIWYMFLGIWFSENVHPSSPDGDLEDASGSFFEFEILSVYIDIEGEKNFNVL